MKMLLVITIAVMLLIPVSSIGITEHYNGEWNRVLGGTGVERAERIIATADGYVIIGYAKVSGKEDFDGWAVKVDKQGNEMWSKNYGGKDEDILNDILATEDGYLLVGYTLSYGGKNAGFWLLSIDEYGNERWNKTYESKDTCYAHDIVGAGNGCIIVGTKGSWYDKNIWAVKIDKNGKEVWNRTYRAGEDCYCIGKTADGYLIGGGLSNCACLIKIAEQGDIDWVRVYSEVYDIFDIVVEEDGYALLGTSPLTLIKTDLHGNKLWERNYGWGNWGRAMTHTLDGYTIVGETDRYGIGSSDVWLFKLDSEGNECWNKSFGSRGSEYAVDVLYLDNSYVILANIQEGWDAWLIKCEDYTPPSIAINKPKEGYLYLFDREICPSTKAIAIGGITIIAGADDPFDKIDRVEFYATREGMLEQELYTIDYNPPYEWQLDKATAGIYDITVGAYYGNAGAVCIDRISVLMFNL